MTQVWGIIFKDSDREESFCYERGIFLSEATANAEAIRLTMEEIKTHEDAVDKFNLKRASEYDQAVKEHKALVEAGVRHQAIEAYGVRYPIRRVADPSWIGHYIVSPPMDLNA
jgi:hypothetical protein